jgi:anaerobic magnesium-protoporphyrin IX monomethyl ester cyclase
MPGSRKVVLFYPPYDGPPLGAPLCLLALASPLLQAGFEVKLVDNLTSPDFENVILREAEDALCLGISILTGPMIGSAIRIAKKVRLSRPGLPIVFGGWHPTLVPEQTLKPDFVDAVVRGPGELTLLELAQRLADGQELHGVIMSRKGPLQISTTCLPRHTTWQTWMFMPPPAASANWLMRVV